MTGRNRTLVAASLIFGGIAILPGTVAASAGDFGGRFEHVNHRHYSGDRGYRSTHEYHRSRRYYGDRPVSPRYVRHVLSRRGYYHIRGIRYHDDVTYYRGQPVYGYFTVRAFHNGAPYVIRVNRNGYAFARRRIGHYGY